MVKVDKTVPFQNVLQNYYISVPIIFRKKLIASKNILECKGVQHLPAWLVQIIT